MAKVIGMTVEGQRKRKAEELGTQAALEKRGLPGLIETEKRIANRPSALEAFREELEIPAKPGLASFMEMPVTAVKGLGVLQERGEAAVANPLMELQRSSEPDLLKRVVSGVGKGLIGEKRGQLGDVVRIATPEIKIGNIDIRESLSSIVGLSAAAGVDIKIAQGARSLLNTLRSSKGTLKSVTKSLDLAKKVKGELGKKIGDFFKSGPGKKPIPRRLVDGIVNSLPEGVLEKIAKMPKTFNVKFTNGAVDTTSENVWKLRMALDDFLTAKEHSGKVTKIGKGIIKNSADQLRGVLASADERIAPLMDNYSRFIKRFNKAEDLLTDKRGDVVLSKAKSALKRGGEA